MIAPPPRPGPIPALALAQTGRDFTIPQPQDPNRQASPPTPALPGEPLPQAPARSGADPFGGLGQAPTGTEIALGAAALAALALLFLFVCRGVRAHLVNRRASLDAANGASWMLFAALTLTAAILVTATVGRLWQQWAGLAAGLALCAVLFCAALLLFLRAPNRRR